MKTREVTMVRIYLTEGEKLLKKIVNYLHNDTDVAGVTVFRGVSGFGASGDMHTSNLLDLSLDLPLVVEFFDQAEKISPVLEEMNHLVESGHIVSWPAQINVQDNK